MVSVGRNDKENQLEMYKNYCFRYITSLEHFKQSDLDPYQIEKQDPDQYQSEKQAPNLYLNGLDPQHWC